MSIKATIVPLPDIPTARYSYVAIFQDVGEYIQAGLPLNQYDPTQPPFDRIILTINDGSEGVMELCMDSMDGQLSINMVNDSQWCDCEPLAFIGLVEGLTKMYTNLKSGKVTCEDIIHGNIQDLLS